MDKSFCDLCDHRFCRFPKTINLCCIQSQFQFGSIEKKKALAAPKPILTVDIYNNLASALKSCLISFPMEFSSTNGWENLCSNDTAASFCFS